VTHRREQHVAALFQTRNGVLANPQGGSHLLLGLLNGMAQVFERGQLHGSIFHPLFPILGQRSHHVIEFFCHV
jgi:hypothetical protein